MMKILSIKELQDQIDSNKRNAGLELDKLRRDN